MTATGGTTPKLTIGERWARAAAVFFDPRVLIVLLLGFSSGLPLALSGSTLLLWMKDVGVNLGTIGHRAPLTLDSDYETPQREFPLG